MGLCRRGLPPSIQEERELPAARAFRFPIALVMYSSEPALFDIRQSLTGAFEQADFEALGFSEIWAVDFSDAYYSPRDPRRLADMFCFKPVEWFGFHRTGQADRKPFG